jgi:hypothetical protein
MASYISSQANRFYTALESAYGIVPAIAAGNRIPALKLTVQNQLQVTNRKDKTGSRTFTGMPVGGRHTTNFEVQTYLTSWASPGPAYGPLFQAALGGTPLTYNGGTVSSATETGQVTFTAPHGLSVGQAVACSGDVRFVTAFVDGPTGSTIQVNAPFTVTPGGNASVGPTVTYTPATELPSVSIFDYWDPAPSGSTGAVQRLLSGAAVNQMDILINADFHEFHFQGVAQDVLDNSSFAGGGPQQLSNFPLEPLVNGQPAAFNYTIVPGNLGQAWLGTSPTQYLTVTSASVQLKNSLDTRMNEFGSSLPQAIAPGPRTVSATFSLYGLTDAATIGLYQAARQQSPVTIMFQCGQTAGQTIAVNLKSVIPQVPEFDDSSNRLQWKFRASRAQGTVNDEVSVAFG